MCEKLDSTVEFCGGWEEGIRGRDWVIIALPAICWELEEVRRKAEVPVCLSTQAKGGMRGELSILRGFGRPDDGEEGRGVGEGRT